MRLLQDYRTARKLSQREFALQIGVPLRTLQEWEQGRRIPRGEAFAKIQALLVPKCDLEPIAFSAALKRYRKEKGFDQRQCATALGLSYGAIQSYEQEKRVPNSKTVARLMPLFDDAEKAAQALESNPMTKSLRAMVACKKQPRREKLPEEQELKFHRAQLKRVMNGDLNKWELLKTKSEWDVIIEKMEEKIRELDYKVQRGAAIAARKARSLAAMEARQRRLIVKG